MSRDPIQVLEAYYAGLIPPAKPRRNFDLLLGSSVGFATALLVALVAAHGADPAASVEQEATARIRAHIRPYAEVQSPAPAHHSEGASWRV
jgi:hypothetical protein